MIDEFLYFSTSRHVCIIGLVLIIVEKLFKISPVIGEKKSGVYII